MSSQKYMKVPSSQMSGPVMDAPDPRIPSTSSSQHLMPDSDSVTASLDSTSRQSPVNVNGHSSLRTISKSEWFTVGSLCFVNLINYMDRYTLPGVLTDIQSDFGIGDDSGGLLQTAFVLSYMICAPIFGYLGDRYSRRWIMILGVALWSGTTLLGSFMEQFGWFLAFRALVGIGEASYSTIAPTIISDLFVNDMRSKMLAMFYFAIPVGSGLGYIVGSETAKAFGSWRWALRVTPILGVIAVFLIFFTKEPNRGESEGSSHLETTSYTKDLKELGRNPSFMLSTLGFTCVAFVTGALAWWGPTFMHLGLQLQPGNENISLKDVSYKFGIIAMIAGLIGVPLGSYLARRLRSVNQQCDPLICAWGLFISAPLVYFALVTAPYSITWCFVFVLFAEISLNLCWSIVADILVSLIFGAITMTCGIIGVPLGTYLAYTLKKKYPRADPLICASGLIISAPLLAGSMLVVTVSTPAAYILVFFGQIALNLNWAIVADILLYVVIPTRRSTAEAFQILISHTFGDAGSPYLVGVISEFVKASIRLTNSVINSANFGGVMESYSLVLANATNTTTTTDIAPVQSAYTLIKDTSEVKFKALQYALFTTSFVEILGGVFFLATAAYIVRDKLKAEKAVKDSQRQHEPTHHYADDVNDSS